MWPLTDAEYQKRQDLSRRVTGRPRGCDCLLCTEFVNYELLRAQDGPRPGETEEEWLQVKREAAESVARRLRLPINLRG